VEYNPKRNHLTYQEEVRERKVQKEKERERVVKPKIECVKGGEGRRGGGRHREREREKGLEKERDIFLSLLRCIIGNHWHMV
jgi:hypothetical protein